MIMWSLCNTDFPMRKTVIDPSYKREFSFKEGEVILPTY